MKVALVSLEQAWEDKAANFRRCAELTAQARAAGADVVVFPEMTLTGFTMNAQAVAEPADASDTVQRFGALARSHGVCIVCGVVLHGVERPRNTLVVLAPGGEELARYAKVHPFSHSGEDQHYEAGDELAVARLGSLRAGLSICYDLRFPELYTALAAHCDALVVIASWPARRIDHWNALLRARAIENQCFVIGVNRVGRDGNGIEHPPSSQVIDPAGRVMEPVMADGELQLFDIDPAVAAAYRARFPVLPDRRDAYTALRRSGELAPIAE